MEIDNTAEVRAGKYLVWGDYFIFYFRFFMTFFYTLPPVGKSPQIFHVHILIIVLSAIPDLLIQEITFL